MAKPTTVDDYCENLTDEAAAHLSELRRLGHAVVPDAVEEVKWGHPAIVHAQGTILFVFSAHQHHANVVFTPSTREAFDDELTGYETGQGSVKLPYDATIPGGLIRRMMEYRITEFEDHGVLWR